MQIKIVGRGWRKQFTVDLIKRLGVLAPITDSDDAEIFIVCEFAENSDELINLAKNGKCLIFLQPEEGSMKLFGQELMYTHHFPFMQLKYGEIPATFLQVFPPISLIKQKYGENLGFFAFNFSPSGENYTTRYPAIVWKEYGSGKIGLFLYDFIATMLLLLQGWEFFTFEGGLSCKSRTGIARAMHLFDHLIDRELASIPQAYFHELVLIALMRILVGQKDPLPRVWHYPYPETTVFLLSGDSDGLEKRLLIKAWSNLLKNDLPYTQYVMLEDLNGFSSSEIAEWKKSGIDFGLHYYAGANPTEKEMAGHMREAKKVFASKKMELISCRGHSCIWVGWDAHVKIMEKAGILYSSNLPYWYTGVSYGFPYFLYTQQARSKVQELQILCSDDTMLFNKTGMLPMTPAQYTKHLIALLDINNDLYYQPVNPIFHPYYMVKKPSTFDVLSDAVSFAKSKAIRIVNHAMFFNWWERRQKIKLFYRIEGKTIEFSSADSDVAIALPQSWKLKNLPDIKILKGNGEYIFCLKRKSYEKE